MKDFQYTFVDNTSLLRTTSLTPEERKIASDASKILGLRRSEFYRRAIIEKAQSVISSTIKANEEASPICEERKDGASFLSVEESIEGEWK